MKTKLLKMIAALIASSVCLNCANTAVIRKTNGSIVQGRIYAGDATNLYVGTTEGDSVLKKVEVADVSHPGPVLALAGAALTVAGTISYVSHLRKIANRTDEEIMYGKNENEFGWVFPSIMMGIGSGMFVQGITLYSKSTGNMNKPLSSADNLLILPGWSMVDGRNSVAITVVKFF